MPSLLKKKKWTPASSRCFAYKCVFAGRSQPQRICNKSATTLENTTRITDSRLTACTPARARRIFYLRGLQVEPTPFMSVGSK